MELLLILTIIKTVFRKDGVLFNPLISSTRVARGAPPRGPPQRASALWTPARGGYRPPGPPIRADPFGPPGPPFRACRRPHLGRRSSALPRPHPLTPVRGLMASGLLSNRGGFARRG